MIDLQIERRKFEEWAKEPCHPEGGYRLETISSGAYINPETRCAWRGWIGCAQLAAPDLCEWWQEDADDEPGTYTTSCHRRWSFTEGDVADNKMTYCMGCGKKTKDLDAAPQGAGQ